MNKNGYLNISLMDQDIVLLPERALYWDNFDALVISDLHLGKSGHFRKHGIAVPESVNTSNIQQLNRLVSKFKPAKIIFLGDLFHSHYNAEFETFKKWRRSYSNIEMILTIGNHDIISRHEFEKIGLECVNTYKCGPFKFMHDEQGNINNHFFSISGHIHPAIKLKSKGRQSIITPCYFIGDSKLLLPAFGSFTGSYLIEPEKNELVYAIVDEKVVNISTLI